MFCQGRSWRPWRACQAVMREAKSMGAIIALPYCGDGSGRVQRRKRRKA
ncbi:Uncharacterised protein [Bordetella pertussis]|nr:Uncharacterised protein [Bordetella pertussis]